MVKIYDNRPKVGLLMRRAVTVIFLLLLFPVLSHSKGLMGTYLLDKAEMKKVVESALAKEVSKQLEYGIDKAITQMLDVPVFKEMAQEMVNKFPKNVVFKKGGALSIKFPSTTYNGTWSKNGDKLKVVLGSVDIFT